ncbi:hypothetical protein F511_36400 [Dorcoceras hygrometricum]|uniref:Uncharacterized protein n=1 Tax=Dorcoceras hygrometricum TaxID=472368 RepID=A0A2Z7CZY6_9LAMI|nr:hypothetical protein F511_36400 [Dorcoceras hygrometricum]
MRMSVNTENSKERYAEFVSRSSELNLLHLPFFRHGKDPLEDFDYNDPRCNPLSTTSSRKNSSLLPLHTSPTDSSHEDMSVGHKVVDVERSSDIVVLCVLCVSRSSELNLLHLPFFRHGKDPLEDFDYNDPRCNPLSTTSSRKNS